MEKNLKRFVFLGLALLLVGFTNSNNKVGCGGTCPQVVPQEAQACTVQITLNKADAGYTHDLYLDGNVPELLISNTKNNVGAIVQKYNEEGTVPRFFIRVYPTSWWRRPYNVYSDSYWAHDTQVSDTARLIEFEDIPYFWSSDRDYNDVVIAVEEISCDGDDPADDPGDDPPPSDPPPPEDPEVGVIVVPYGGAAKVHVNFLQGTSKVGGLFLAGNPPELLVARGSTNHKGASARNFFYAGEGLIFFMRVDGVDYYSNDPGFALLDQITDHNYRIYFDVDGDAIFEDVIVHVVLTPPDR